jgi:hypothetical protein
VTENAEPSVVRFALAVIASCTTAAALYAIVRIGQSRFGHEPNPALVIWSEHAGFFWRSWTVAYAGVMVGFVAWLAAGRNAKRVAEVLARAVVAAAALLAAQAIFVP